MSEIVEKFANRLNTILTIRNMKPVELHEKTGISESLISKYLSDNAVARLDKLTILSDTLNVNPVWLMGYDVPMEREIKQEASSQSKQYYMCPVYGRISAGQPNWAEECVEGRIPIDYQLMNILNPEECFFLRVNGESMNKEIKNGAYALIRKQETVENGEIAVVLVNGYDATLKKFSMQGDLVILEPMSDDSNFTTQVYNKDTEIKIIGKYIGKMEMK